jgi:hypothetical protein
MKKLLFGTLLLALTVVVPIPTMAQVGISINIGLPPPIVFAAPPDLIVLPETYVYVVPDVDVDIFFYNGWWWRPWEGRWYRSRSYNSGWAYYQSVPSFYAGIPSGWRNDYRQQNWRGHQWNYQRISHERVQRNWSGWEKNRYWEKQQTWGVQGLQPRTRVQQPSRQMQSPQSRSQLREAGPDRPQQQHREAAKPQQSQPQRREATNPQHPQPQRPQAQSGPQGQQHRDAGPQRGGQPQHSQPQQGGHEKGK